MQVHPKLHDADLEKVALVYADLRRESMVSWQADELAFAALEIIVDMPHWLGLTSSGIHVQRATFNVAWNSCI